ncbi:MAG: hypothetical protein KAJ49_07720, partial [Arcobacteraceae bacterium]|nr:hypothetical protein [Arcobacteraceae bacterium]
KGHTIEKSADFDASKQRFDIVVRQNKETGEQKFYLPQDRLNSDGQMVIQCNKYIVFDVVSEDLTYGFGIFRKDGSMVTQMQVTPGSRNDLMWQFPKNGIYTIRSTEYSGPQGGRYMTQKDVIKVVGCDIDDARSMGGN